MLKLKGDWKFHNLCVLSVLCGFKSFFNTLIGTLMVDFIGVYNPLTEEALDNAVEVAVYGIPTRVFRPEYLMTIALQTGRAQDLRKIVNLYEESNFNEEYLGKIIKRHGLSRKWNEFKKRYIVTGEESRLQYNWFLIREAKVFAL
ncbi:MAG: hypothetical protein AB1393_10545 [Candidatus Edwardsbacteria bacterium]